MKSHAWIKISEVLEEVWDPIGVAGVPEAKGEYGYALYDFGGACILVSGPKLPSDISIQAPWVQSGNIIANRP